MLKNLISLLTLTSLVALLAGCGGGATAPTAPAPGAAAPATLKALVVENDGQTTALDGFAFTLVETGQTAVSAVDGSLDFGPVPTGDVTLRHVDPAPLVVLSKQGSAGSGGNGDGGSGDGGNEGGDAEQEQEREREREREGEHDPDDGEHAERREVRVERVQARERIEIRIHMGEGEMVRVQVSRGDKNEREVEIQMTRTEANDDPDMEGELELERNVHRQEFEVEVENADTGRDLELFVVAPDGTEESQGVRTVDAMSEAEWELDTGDGGRLPFAVSDLEDLEDHDVEVRDADTGDVLLTATVPELPPVAPFQGDGAGGDDDDGSGDDGDDDESRLRGRALLTAVEAGLEGYVEIRSRTDDGETRERFKMQVEGLAVGREVEFFVEDPTQAGTFLTLGTRDAHGTEGKAHLQLCTGHGDALPGGASAVSALVGLDVEIRDADTGDLLLEGTVPQLIAD
jgi:hypothetical protein